MSFDASLLYYRPQANRTNSHVRALSACFENALNVLGIASKDFREFGVLVSLALAHFSLIDTLCSATGKRQPPL
jgi:hypothetical protein